jgi:hypothetical protein
VKAIPPTLWLPCSGTGLAGRVAAGADDELVGPFAVQKLLVRLHVLLRRSRGARGCRVCSTALAVVALRAEGTGEAGPGASTPTVMGDALI